MNYKIKSSTHWQQTWKLPVNSTLNWFETTEKHAPINLGGSGGRSSSSSSSDFHKYADDTELSKSSTPDQFNSAQKSIENCIDDVLSWMNGNKLKLNTDKTEVMKKYIQFLYL